MKKIFMLFSFVFCIYFFIFSPKVFAFEIIPDINENYQTEDAITIRKSSILGRPSYVTETYDSKYCLKKFYRLERRAKCIVYYVVEYTYNSPSKCWLQDCYYIFDANPNHYVALKRYKSEGNKYIYDDVVDNNCYYFSYD